MQVLSVPVSQHFQRVNSLLSLSEAGKRFAAGHRTVFLYRARYCERLIWHTLEVQWCWDVIPPHKAWDPQLKSNASWCLLFIFLIFSSRIPWKPCYEFPHPGRTLFLEWRSFEACESALLHCHQRQSWFGSCWSSTAVSTEGWWHPWDFRKVVGK